MPAAAVIPAPIAYIKVVVVKKLVVGSQPIAARCTDSVATARLGVTAVTLLAVLFTGRRKWSARLL